MLKNNISYQIYCEKPNQPSILNESDTNQAPRAKASVISFSNGEEISPSPSTKVSNSLNVRVKRQPISFDSESSTNDNDANNDGSISPSMYDTKSKFIRPDAKKSVISFEADSSTNDNDANNDGSISPSMYDTRSKFIRPDAKQCVISFEADSSTNDNDANNDGSISPLMYDTRSKFNRPDTKKRVISFYPEKPNKIENIITLNTKSFDCHDIDFITGNNGHLYVNLSEGIQELSNFYISPIKIVIKDNGLYQEIFYRIKCILENGEEEKTISISSYDLSDPKWINLKLGIKFYTSAERNSYALFKIYLSKQFRNVTQELQYDLVGWKQIGGKYFYLHGNGAIGSINNPVNGSSNKRIEIDPSLNARSALEGALTLMNLSNNPEKTLPLFLYSHLSVLTELFNLSGARPKFVLWIYGLTGSMKTSVSTVFFNLFNRVSKPEISATFKDTPSAIEIKAFESKDSTLLVDDYHPTTSYIERRSMESLASHILRMYGDGITKSRATKTMGKQKEYPPRGLCVITGEDRLFGESTVARYIGIEVTSGDYRTDILSYHQNNPLIYSSHMFYFIQWISYNYFNIQNLIKNKFSQYRNESLCTFNHKRLNESFAIFKIMSEIILNYCISVGYYDSNSASLTLKQWTTIMLQVIKLHEESNTTQSPAIMYIIAIDELISSNKCSLAPVGQSNSDKQNLIGYKDEDYYYLIPETTYTNVKNFWKYQGIEFPVSQEQLNKALDNNKIIETTVEGHSIRRTIKCNPDGKNRKRYLKVKIEMIKKILSN